MNMRKIIGRISQFLFPFYGFCYCCGRTWNVCNEHVTNYQSNHGRLVTRGCFPLCERCWQELTIEERLPYYEKLWDGWVKQGTDKTDDTKNLIILAVREGK